MGLIPRNIKINDKERDIYLEIKGKLTSVKMSILLSIVKKHGWDLIIGKWGDDASL